MRKTLTRATLVAGLTAVAVLPLAGVAQAGDKHHDKCCDKKVYNYEDNDYYKKVVDYFGVNFEQEYEINQTQVFD